MPNSHERSNPDVAFEHSDIRSTAVVGTGIALLLGTLLVAGLLWFPFVYFRGTHPNPAPRAQLASEYKNIRQPLLQQSPRWDLEQLRKRDRQLLDGYTWVDKANGRVSIPIERAIDKLVRQGMPATGDYSDLKLVVPHSGSRETGFDLVTGPGAGP